MNLIVLNVLLCITVSKNDMIWFLSLTHCWQFSDAGGECYATRGRSRLGDVLEHQPTTCCSHPLITGFPIYSGEPGHPAGHKCPSCMLRGQATSLRKPLSLWSTYNFPQTRLVTSFQLPYPISSSYIWQSNPTDIFEKSWKCCIGRLWHIFHCREASMFVNLATHCFVFTSANFSIMCTSPHNLDVVLSDTSNRRQIS